MPDDAPALDAPPVDTPPVDTPPVDDATPVDDTPDEAEQLRAQIAERDAQLELYRRQQLDILARNQTFQQQPPTDPDAEKQQRDAEYFRDPSAYAKKQAQEASAAVYRAMDSQLTEMAVSSYRAVMQTDPYFKSALPEFDKAVERAKNGLVGLSPQQKTDALEFMKYAALGKTQEAARTRQAAKPAAAKPAAPNLGGGGAGAAKPASDFADPVDQQAYDQFISYGYKPEDAKRMVEEQE